MCQVLLSPDVLVDGMLRSHQQHILSLEKTVLFAEQARRARTAVSCVCVPRRHFLEEVLLLCGSGVCLWLDVVVPC